METDEFRMFLRLGWAIANGLIFFGLSIAISGDLGYHIIMGICASI
ncbi:MAG: hypothetical protein WCD53_04680 [Microcoleus sp.]